VKHFIEDLEEAFNAPNFSARLAHINLWSRVEGMSLKRKCALADAPLDMDSMVGRTFLCNLYIILCMVWLQTGQPAYPTQTKDSKFVCHEQAWWR
jgi:hypothetical protein